MKYRQDGFNWIVRLERGEKLADTLLGLVREQGIPNCWVSGLGAAQSAELGYYDLEKKEYVWQQVDELLEIVGLQGNITGAGEELKLHLHGTFSRPNLQTIGGHVKDLVVGGTCELFLHKWYGDPITRQHDDATGLNVLDL
jgi:predicted DNA-binding protein with PD1-like motif